MYLYELYSYGRRCTFSSSMLLGGLFCFAIIFFSSGNENYRYIILFALVLFFDRCLHIDLKIFY